MNVKQNNCWNISGQGRADAQFPIFHDLPGIEREQYLHIVMPTFL